MYLGIGVLVFTVQFLCLPFGNEVNVQDHLKFITKYVVYKEPVLALWLVFILFPLPVF